HKSGFAFDFRSKNYLYEPRYPLRWVKNDPLEEGQTTWTVYAHVNRRLKDTEYRKGDPAEEDGPDEPAYYLDSDFFPDYEVDEKTFVEYADSISPWEYDAYNPDGGTVSDEIAASDGCAFLNLTKVCARYNLVSINAHKGGDNDHKLGDW